MATQEQSPAEHELDRIRSQVASDAAVLVARLLARSDEWRTDEPETCPGSPRRRADAPSSSAVSDPALPAAGAR